MQPIKGGSIHSWEPISLTGQVLTGRRGKGERVVLDILGMISQRNKIIEFKRERKPAGETRKNPVVMKAFYIAAAVAHDSMEG